MDIRSLPNKKNGVLVGGYMYFIQLLRSEINFTRNVSGFFDIKDIVIYVASIDLL